MQRDGSSRSQQLGLAAHVAAQANTGGVDFVRRAGTQVGNGTHQAGDAFAPSGRDGFGRDRHALGANGERDVVARAKPQAGNPDRDSSAERTRRRFVIDLHHAGGQQVAGADEIGHEGIGGTTVDFERCTLLFDAPAAHYHDHVSDAECFVLIMRDKDRRDAQAFLQVADLAANALAKLGVEVR